MEIAECNSSNILILTYVTKASFPPRTTHLHLDEYCIWFFSVPGAPPLKK